MRKAAPLTEGTAFELRKRGGRYWDRTSDLFGVKDVPRPVGLRFRVCHLAIQSYGVRGCSGLYRLSPVGHSHPTGFGCLTRSWHISPDHPRVPMSAQVYRIAATVHGSPAIGEIAKSGGGITPERRSAAGATLRLGVMGERTRIR
jgi:hypothetical protein